MLKILIWSLKCDFDTFFEKEIPLIDDLPFSQDCPWNAGAAWLKYETNLPYVQVFL